MNLSTRENRLAFLDSIRGKTLSDEETLQYMTQIVDWAKGVYGESGKCVSQEPGVGCCYYDANSPFESCAIGAFMPIEIANKYRDIGGTVPLNRVWGLEHHLVLDFHFWGELQLCHDQAYGS